MPRGVPAAVRRELEQPSSGDALVEFVSITHPWVDGTIRLVNDGADYVRDGATWYRSGFSAEVLTDTDQPPRAQFSFPNVDREAVMKFRYVVGPAMLTLEMISTSYFDLTAERAR